MLRLCSTDSIIDPDRCRPRRGNPPWLPSSARRLPDIIRAGTRAGLCVIPFGRGFPGRKYLTPSCSPYRTTDRNGTTKNTYDKAGRLVRVEYPEGKTVSYLYDAGGNRTRLTYPEGTYYINYEYDVLNRLTDVRDSSGTLLAHYVYDSLGRRSSLAYANGAGASYDYDSAGRLLCVDNQTANGQHK